MNNNIIDEVESLKGGLFMLSNLLANITIRTVSAPEIKWYSSFLNDRIEEFEDEYAATQSPFHKGMVSTLRRHKRDCDLRIEQIYGEGS